MRNYKKWVCILLAVALLAGCGKSNSKPKQDFTTVPSETPPAQVQPNVEGNIKYRAIWISYLEWPNFDTSSAEAFTQSVQTLYDNCVSIGLNCVIVQVRPFSDAIYPSKIFPWSHVVTGTQGQDPGYDPLAILVEQAHARGLAFEAWINPYRVRLTENMPKGELAATNPAVQHPDWTRGLTDDEYASYYLPSSPQVSQMIVDGVVELIENYDIDGIQFDDYFYPTTDPEFDADHYETMGAGKDQAQWRRENVNTLVRTVYAAIKAADSTVIFGISPQGNNEQNYNTQYSDVALWLEQPGYVDYIMPQVYWGYGFTLSNGKTQFAFENIIREWAARPRHESVSLAMGLGAYRVGRGDSGSNDQAEWQNGHNLADMVNTLSTVEGIRGFALYRYDNLFANKEYPELATQESAALQKVLVPTA